MTSLLLMLTLTGLPGDHTAEIAFIQNMQTPAGGFITELPGTDPEARPTLRTTRTGLRALRLLGGKVANRPAVIRFLYGCYDSETGGFAARPGLPPDPISTSVGLMIHRELNLPVDDLVAPALAYMNRSTEGFEQIRMVAPGLEEFGETVPQVETWVNQINEARNADGSFGTAGGKARSTSLYVVAGQRLGQTYDRERILAILQAGQREDGGFGNEHNTASDLESCYRIVRLFRRFDACPEHTDALRDFIARCKNDDGGYGRTPDQPSSLHGTYYATILHHWLDKYQDNFDDVPPGTIPPGWQTAKELDAPGSEWEVIQDPTHPDNHVLKQTSSAGANKQFNICVSNRRFQDAEISVDVTAVSGKIDQGGGLVWRYQDSQNYYIARWNPLEDNFRMYKVVDGVRTQLDTAQAPGDPSQPHNIRIIYVGRDLRGYFDGKLLLEAEDDQFPGWGNIGVWSKADAVTTFDNLRSRYTEKFALEGL